MTEGPSATDAARLLTHLAQARPGHHRSVAPKELRPEIALLRSFQSERLATTHTDLLNSPRYRPAAQFFLNDVYAPRDFSQRDADLQRFYDGVSKVLPEKAVSILADVVELSTLTDGLDSRLADVLVRDLGMSEGVTLEQYAEAYRICDNYDERLHQIQLIDHIGRGIDRLVQIPFIGLSLRLAHAPAVLAGWSELQGYLERGFTAFKHMKGADGFLGAITRREKDILDRIYAGDIDPFRISQ
jgi:hypothetical protein